MRAGLRRTMCERPKPRLVYVFPDGTLGAVRCEAPNKCVGCAWHNALENALVVRLDALEGGRWPTWGLTTTTARPWSRAAHGDLARSLKAAERLLWKQLRRDYGAGLEYLGFVEFTTGRAASSGGARRAHVHHLVKGLGRADAAKAAALERRVSALWRTFTRDAWRVECRPLRTPMGAIAYLALHHHKAEQRPPAGWSGKRFRPSRGYFDRPVAELRREARELLVDRRIEQQLVRAWNVPDGFDGAVLDELLLDALPAARERAAASRPSLFRVTARGLRPVER